MRLFYVYGLPQVSRSAPLQSPPVRYAETASALTVEAKYHSHPFAGGRRPWPFCWGSEREARAYRGKLSKAKPRDSKGVVCRGLPWVLFWPEILLTRSRLITFQTFVPFHLITDAGKMQSASGQRESAANRRLETHGGKPKG